MVLESLKNNPPDVIVVCGIYLNFIYHCVFLDWKKKPLEISQTDLCLSKLFSTYEMATIINRNMRLLESDIR